MEVRPRAVYDTSHVVGTVCVRCFCLRRCMLERRYALHRTCEAEALHAVNFSDNTLN
jgi:hypothetical protein